jgi:hypothetical protein
MASRLALYHPPGRIGLKSNPFGKDVANLQLYRALARYGGYGRIDLLSNLPVADSDAAADLFPEGRATCQVAGGSILSAEAPAEGGVLFRGQPDLDAQAWIRRKATGDRGYSLVGLIHTLAPPAMRQIIAARMATPLPITILLTSDEEIGSPSTRDLIEAEAARHKFVLVPEPARADGGVVTGRYAIARFNLKTTGRPSHAGARLAEGRSSIKEMCRQILAIEDMTTEDCTFSVGVLHGGQWVNCVTTTTEAEALSMAKRQEDLDAGVARMLALRSSTNDVQLEVTRGVTRPVWEPDAKVLALYRHAREIAQAIGFDINHQSSGGGSDGNFTGALGITTLDGLGVQGAMAHTLEEHVLIDSLVPRAKLMAGLLTTLN